jgi:hypothetical protein
MTNGWTLWQDFFEKQNRVFGYDLDYASMRRQIPWE